jgi:DNA repair exonuclease SbcCD ATPase subunit
LIKFKTVRWKNFLSTGNTFTEIELTRNPSTLIIGENGSGKSTILDALCFGLFGKPFRTINKPQLINSINGSGLLVEVEFTVGSRNYKVVRGIKPNVFEIYNNNKPLNQEANVRDYQKILEQQILKLNYQSFTQVVILGSSTFIPFMQLKARHRREVVEEILDIQIFSLMNMLLKIKLKDLQEELVSTDNRYELITEKISLQENYIDDLKKNKDKLINTKKESIENNTNVIQSRTSEREELENANVTFLEQIKDQQQVEQKETKLKDFRATLAEKHKSHSSMLDFFDNNADCPTCQQHIDEMFKEEMTSQQKQEVKKYQIGMDKMKSELTSTKQRLEEIKEVADKIRDNQLSIAQLNTSIIELEKFNTKLETEIESFNGGGISKSDTDKLKNLKDEHKKIDGERQSAKEERNYVEAAKIMLQDTGIKTKIIKQYLPIMNKLINKYLTSMEFYINFTLNENFEETIKSRYRDEFTYASFSEGEKMRIDLALLFTWRAIAKMKNSTNTNLLVLDEIFDSSLDNTGTDEFLKILNTLAGENVFVISHKQDVLVDKFRSTIKFEKVKNFSHVVV